MRSLKRAATIANRSGPTLRAARRIFGARPAISVGKRRQQVPELVALGAEVLPVGLRRRNLDRDALGDVETIPLEADDLLRVVGQGLQILGPEGDDDLAHSAKVRWDLGRRDPPPQLFLVNPVFDEIPDRDHLQAVRLGQLGQLRHPRHAAILVEDLADDARRVTAGQPREIDRGFGVARTSQDSAAHRSQRQDVTGTGQVVGAHQGVDERADRDGPVVGGRAGGDASTCIYGHRDRRSHGGGVVGNHHRDLELVEALSQEGHANQATAVLRHEVHRFRGHAVGRHHEVTLVLAVLVVHDEEDAPLPDLLDALLDGRKRGHVVPLSASERTRYLPITSASMFVARPGTSRPSVVTASVCGISITSKVRSPSAATVRLTPSMATDPWGIRSGSSSRLGSGIRTRPVDSTPVTASPVPPPSTRPRTRCPPRAPPKRRGRSRFTGSPGARCLSAVRARVSGPISNTKPSGRRSTIVRHTPFTAMLPPTSAPSTVTPASTSSVATRALSSIARIEPISSTIPVNIRRLATLG